MHYGQYFGLSINPWWSTRHVVTPLSHHPPALRADPAWAYFRQGSHRGGSACPPVSHPCTSGGSDSSSGKKRVKRKKIKSNTVLFFTVFPSLWQTWDFRREKEAFFSARSWVWMSPFRSFVGCENLTAWVTIYAKRSVRKWRPTQLAKC